MPRLLVVSLALVLAACAPPYPGDESAGRNGETTAAPPAALPASEDELAAVRAALARNVPELKVESLRPTPLPGIYEVQVGMNFGYVTADGAFLIAGDLTDLKNRRELTEDRRRELRIALMQEIEKDGVIEFPARQLPAKYTVTIFTDIDCGYCQLLHKQIEQYNAEGISVHYAFFPRSGPNTESFYKAEQVWCSADRQAALTRAKRGEAVGGDRSCSNPIMQHLRLAASLGLRGTPAIVLPDGNMLPGYHPPAELLQILAQQAAHGPAG